jgi:hypothetical protein
LLRELANPNLHDISTRLPFRVELWNVPQPPRNCLELHRVPSDAFWNDIRLQPIVLALDR